LAITLQSVTASISRLDDALDAHTLYDVAGSFSCHQAEAIADVFRAVGFDSAAERVLDFHSLTDDAIEGDLSPHVERSKTAAVRQGLVAA